MNQYPCTSCGHSKKYHIYEVGPCRPGFECACAQYVYAPAPAAMSKGKEPPPRVWLRWGSNWCEGHLSETPDEVPYVPESTLEKVRIDAQIALLKILALDGYFEKQARLRLEMFYKAAKASGGASDEV